MNPFTKISIKGSKLDWTLTSKGDLTVTVWGYRIVVLANNRTNRWSAHVIKRLDEGGEKLVYIKGPYLTKEEAAMAFEKLYFDKKRWELI